MDVKDTEIKKPGSADETLANGTSPDEKQKEAGREVAGPTVGFDQEGYFFVKIHMTYSYLAMLGFLDEAREWLMLRHKGSSRNQFKEDEAKQLIKPKGFRGFNLFK